MKLRKAAEDDLLLTHQWANDPLVRSNSYSQSTIDMEVHRQWFIQKIQDVNALYLIAEEKTDVVGQVRFEKDEDKFVIGVTVAPLHRGKGYSTKMLEMAVDEYAKHWSLPVYAFIKCANVASIRAFEKAGFEFSKELEYLGSPSKLYIWK